MWFVYNELMTFLKQAAKSSQVWEQYLVELQGPDTIQSAPRRYNDLNMILELRIPLHEWDNPHLYTPRRQAEIRAQRYLKAMVDFVERHYEKQDKALKDAAAKGSANG